MSSSDKNIPNINDGSNTIVNNITVTGGGNSNASFVTVNPEPSLANERVLSVGSSLTLNDGGPGNNVTIDLANSGVTAGSYTNSNVTVDSKGRVVGITNGSNGITTINTDSNLNSSVSGSTVTLSLNNTGVVAGNYNYPTLSVDLKGRISSISSNTPVTSVSSDGNVTTSASNGAVMLGLSNSGVVSGNYSYPTLNIDNKGRILAASTNTPVTSINTDTNITTSSSNGAVTLGLGNSGVTAGSYTTANITVDSKGRITSASNGSGSLSFPISYTTSGVIATFLNSRLSSDSQDRFQLGNDGWMYWGGGSSSTDVYLSRESSTTLRLGNSALGFNRGTFRCGSILVDSINNNTYRYIDIYSSGSTNGTGTNNISMASDGSDFSGGGSRCVSIATLATVFGSGNYNTAISNASGKFSSSSYNAIIGSTDGTISASNGCNIIMGSGNGNTTISGSAGGSFLWGSYISTNNANVFGLSDSSSTAVSVGTAKTFYTRFTGNHYFTTNTGASLGAQLAGGSSSWSAISDIRLKDIHCEIDGEQILEHLDNLRVVKFNYKCDKEDGCHDARVGMIAQEVNGMYMDLGLRKNYNPAHPYCVEHPDEEPIQTVCGDEIAYLSIAAVKAQNQVVQRLENEVNSLKDEVSKLKAALKDAISVIKDLDSRLTNLVS